MDRGAVRQQRLGARRQPRRLPRRVQLRRDHRAVGPPLRGAARADGRGRVHQRHRQHRVGLGAGRRRAAGQPAGHPGQLPHHAGLRHPPRAGQAQELRRAHLPGRGRDRRVRRGARGGLRRPPRGDLHERSRRGPQERDHEPRHQPRAALAPGRHPARWPVDRPAHQDRGRRPPDRPLRPPRRGATAGRGGLQPDPLLLRRDRGRPAGPEVPHPGDPAVRRLPGQRRRAVAPPRRRRPPRHLRALRHRDEPRGRRRHAGVLALPPRSRDAGPPLGHPRDARAAAPRRRAGEGGRHRQHRLHAGEPQQDGAAPRRQGGRHRQRHPAGDGGGRRGRRAADRRLGEHLGGHRRRGAAGPAARPQGGLDPPGPPQPAPGQPGRHRPPLPEDPDARAQPRPAVQGRPSRVPGRRQVPHQGGGPALHRHRDRGRHRGDVRSS